MTGDIGLPDGVRIDMQWTSFVDKRVRLCVPKHLRRRRGRQGYLFEGTRSDSPPRSLETLLVEVGLDEDSRDALRACILGGLTTPPDEHVREEVLRCGRSDVRECAVESVILMHHLKTGETDYKWDVLFSIGECSVCISVFATAADFRSDEECWKRVIQSIQLASVR